jgi:hypothetical protein
MVRKTSKTTILNVFLLLAITEFDIPNGVFRWGTSDDSNVLATWHSYGVYLFISYRMDERVRV